MSSPLITVGLTAYNAQDTLAAALSSILAQTWRPLEIVAVDDCSSDVTWELLNDYAQRYPELRIFRNDTNGGVAVSRNRILQEARGEFLAFFDDDDESAPGRIAAQYERITNYECAHAHGQPVICHTARRVIYPEGEARIEATMGQSVGSPAPSGAAVAHRILMGHPLSDGYGACPTCSQMARLSTYRCVNGFDPSLRRGEDTDLNIRLALAGCHFAGIGEPLVTQRMTRTSDKSLAEEHRNMLYMMDKYRALMEEAGEYVFCRGWQDARYAWQTGRRFDFAAQMLGLGLRHPVLTLRRAALALPNFGLNRAFQRFHSGAAPSGE